MPFTSRLKANIFVKFGSHLLSEMFLYTLLQVMFDAVFLFLTAIVDLGIKRNSCTSICCLSLKNFHS